MTILQILDLGEHIFEAVVPTAIILLMNKEALSHPLLYTDLTNAYKDKDLFTNLQFITKNQLEFKSNPNNVFIVNPYTSTGNNVLFLNDILSFKDAGINYQRVNVGLAQKGKSDLGQRLLYESNHKESNSDYEYYKGSDIDAYYIAPHTFRYCRTDIHLRENERVIINSDYFAITPKLIWRQTAAYPICVVDNIGIWFGRSIQAGILKRDYQETVQYEYLCALLNSKYLRYRYELNVKETGRVFPQVKLEKLRTLPIVIPAKEIQDTITNIVNEIITLKKDNPQTDTAKKEQTIDSLVYHLYGLTYDEVLIVDPQTPITREEYEN